MILNKIMNVFFVFLLLFTFVTIFEFLHWIPSLFSHFREWAVLSSIVILITSFTLVKTSWWLRVGLFILLVFQISSLWPFLFSNFNNQISHFQHQEKVIKVFYANINSQNNNKTRLIESIRSSQADFVFLVEVNRAWMEKLKEIKNLYPYSKAIVLENNFGVAVFSEYPLEVQDVLVEREYKIPALFLESKSPMGPLDLVVLHSYPPLGKRGTLMRNQYLESVSRRIGERDGTALVCGDFNTTPWSFIFKRFLEYSKLTLRKSFLSLNSWPTFPFPMIPIDHCLIKGGRVIKYTSGQSIGSDHLPLNFWVVKGN